MYTFSIYSYDCFICMYNSVICIKSSIYRSENFDFKAGDRSFALDTACFLVDLEAASA